MNSTPTLVVMAAGIGSRYGGLKQIDPVGPGGEAVLDYSVFDAQRAGFGKVVFIIRKDIEEAFRQNISQRFEKRIDVRYTFQELDKLPPPFTLPAGRTKPWGTGHALLCAAEEVTGPCAVINADDFYGLDAYRVMHRFLSNPPLRDDRDTYAMVGYYLKATLSEHGTVARGVTQTDSGGCLTTIDELLAIEKLPRGARNKFPDGSYREMSGEEIVSMNFWGFTPSVLDHLRRLFVSFLERDREKPKSEFYIPVSMDQLIKAGQARVRVLPTNASWFGVTYREDRPIVIESIQKLIRAGEYPERLWA